MIQLYSNLPTLDLHGTDRDYARVLINDFIKDNYNSKNNKVIIVHGVGTGIIRERANDKQRRKRQNSSSNRD